MGSQFERFETAFNRMTLFFAALVAISIGLIAFLIPLNLVMIRLQLGGIWWLFEGIEYALFAGVFLGAPWVLQQNAHVKVDFLVSALPKAAAAQLEREGISIEVVDPRTLKPLDEDTILDSVRKTNRLVIVHEAWMRGGIGAEVAAIVVDKAFDHLDAPIKRVGAPDTPMPYNDELERATIPSQDRIVEAIREVLA